MRRMRHQEHMRAVGTHYGPTRICFAAYYARSIGTHYGPTRTRLAGFSLRHRRDGRAGTTILQLVSASDDQTKALPSDYGPAAGGLLEQGQRRRIRRSRRTVLRDYGQEEAANSRRRAVGTTGPFQGPRTDREQRTPPSTPPGPQYLSRNHGPDGSARWLCRSAQQQEDGTNTRPSWSGPTSKSDARELAKASTRRSTDGARAG